MDTRTLRAQHRVIIRQATALNGLAGVIKTRDDASQACHAIQAIDRLLVRHLTIEDEWLYPGLMSADDPGVQKQAAEAFEDMGGILQAWLQYRDGWSVDRVFADPERFAAATRGIVGALALRVEREDDTLYPAMDGLQSQDRAA